ncbi:MAG: hypothetical protein ACI8Y3_001935 [Paraglaciecola sp.]|jgi:hypothetical protein
MQAQNQDLGFATFHINKPKNISKLKLLVRIADLNDERLRLATP